MVITKERRGPWLFLVSLSLPALELLLVFISCSVYCIPLGTRQGLFHTKIIKIIIFPKSRIWILISFRPCGQFNCSSELVGISSILATQSSFLIDEESSARKIDKNPDNTWMKSIVKDSLSSCNQSDSVVKVIGWLYGSSSYPMSIKENASKTGMFSVLLLVRLTIVWALMISWSLLVTLRKSKISLAESRGDSARGRDWQLFFCTEDLVLMEVFEVRWRVERILEITDEEGQCVYGSRTLSFG